MTSRLVMLLLCSLLASSAAAIDTERFDDPELQARYERLANELRCLKCQNQTIADSNAMIAGDLRRHLRRLLEEGATDEEILDFMVARYGDFVRYRPAFAPRTWWLWGAPAVFLLIGGITAVTVISKRSHLPIDDEDESSG